METEESTDSKGKKTKKSVVKEAFATPVDDKILKVFIKSGTRLYCKGEKGRIMAVELPRFAGFDKDFVRDIDVYRRFFDSPDPDKCELPGKWVRPRCPAWRLAGQR